MALMLLADSWISNTIIKGAARCRVCDVRRLRDIGSAIGGYGGDRRSLCRVLGICAAGLKPCPDEKSKAKKNEKKKQQREDRPLQGG